MGFTYDHIHLRSADVASTVAFYKTNFEAEVVEPSRPDGGIGIKIGGAKVLITPLQQGQEIDPVMHESGGRSLDHFGLAVTNIDEIADKMKANGVVFTRGPVTTRPGLRIAFLTAPDNVKIELLQRG